MARVQNGTRIAAALCVVLGATTAIACSTQEQVLHGKVSQLTPTICVAAPRASGNCFDPSSVNKGLTLAIGDCVTVHYTPAKVPTAPSHIKTIKRENCA